MKICIYICVLIFVVIDGFDPQHHGRNCQSVNDCVCGEMCVNDETSMLCHDNHQHGTCTCRPGCGVFDTFIPAGMTNPNTYCNHCECDSDTARYGSIPSCTRMMWCADEVGDVPVYPDDINCNGS